jgi:type VI secretion system ImpM family protein
MTDPTSLRAIREPACFGKLPSALDFVRIHHDYPEAVQLDRWLTAGLQRLDARGLSWPSEPLRFVFVPGASATALLGAVAASRDRAGRAFPIAIFAAFTPATDLTALPLAAEDFLEQAEELLSRSAMLSAPDLNAAMTRLRTPPPSALRAARERIERQLSERRLDAFAHAHFAGQPAAAIAAFERVLEEAARGPGELVFDCPIDSLGDVAVWSRLAALVLGRAPSCLWSGWRMLLALGPLPERAPLYWAAPARKYPQLCPVSGRSGSIGSTPARDERSLAALFAELVRSEN